LGRVNGRGDSKIHILTEAIETGVHLRQACPALEYDRTIRRCQIIQKQGTEVIFFDEPGRKFSFRRREIHSFAEQIRIFVRADGG